MQITCSNLRHDDTVVEFDDALVFRGRRKRSEHEKRQHDSRHGSRFKIHPRVPVVENNFVSTSPVLLLWERAQRKVPTVWQTAVQQVVVHSSLQYVCLNISQYFWFWLCCCC